MKKCQHEWKKVKITEMISGSTKRTFKVFQCAKCKKMRSEVSREGEI